MQKQLRMTCTAVYAGLLSATRRRRPAPTVLPRNAQLRSFLLIWAGLVAVLICMPLSAAPYVPRTDAQVLEHLRSGPADASLREARKLRASLARDPGNVDKAVETARRYIEQARAEADPRFFGYAQAALGPWWNLPNAPSDVLFLRATLLQAAHNFKGALTDLDRLLSQEPSHLEAYLLRAVMMQVVGRYDEAKQDCQPLIKRARRHRELQLTAVTCLASIASFNGQADMALQALVNTFKSGAADMASSDDIQWAYTTLADTAARLDRPAEAEKYFKQGLQLGRNAWLLGAYADFLLDHKRPRDVIDLLKKETSADTLLLLLTLAEQQVNAPELGKHTEILRERYAAMRSRNDMRHLREEARFSLHLLNQPRAALKLALADWQIQHEPEDARIVLASALAAKDYVSAQPVLDFLKEKRTEDAVLTRLVEQFEKISVTPPSPAPATDNTTS